MIPARSFPAGIFFDILYKKGFDPGNIRIAQPAGAGANVLSINRFPRALSEQLTQLA
jgi:hypothetical protein